MMEKRRKQLLILTTITDASGNLIAIYKYEEWGNLLAIETAEEDNAQQLAIAEANPFRYRSYYYDMETGYYYLQSRYYDASICRFINTDKVEFVGIGESIANTNLFTYCANEPVNDRDEMGNVSLKTVSKVINKIISSIKKIVNWVRDAVNTVYKMYVSISPKDISKIAKDIGRSPHRVKQSLERILEKLTKIRSTIGKMATGIGILAAIASLGEKFARLGNVTAIIAELVIETMEGFVQWLFEAGIKVLAKLIPAIGTILTFFAPAIASFVVAKIFATKQIRKIRSQIKAKINVASYGLVNYFSVFFKYAL